MRISQGIQYMLLATFLFACMNALVKLVPHIPSVEVVLFRSIVSLVMSYVTLRANHIPVMGNNKLLLVSRGATGAVALVLYFTLIQEVPLATAVTLQFLSPIFTAIIGMILLKEKVRLWQWFFFLLSFAGILIVNGFDTRIAMIHVIMGIGAAIGSGSAYNIVRKLRESEHPLVIVMYFPLVTLPITGLYSIFHWVQPTGWDWLVLLGIGTLTQMAQYFMTKAYQKEEVSKVANISYLGIIYALSFGYFFFDETFNMMTYLGMFVVLLGVILNVWYKSKVTRKPTPAKPVKSS